MRYVLIDEVGMDVFNKEFENKEEAMKKAELEWEKLSDYDKKRRTAFYLFESANPDEEAENHFDGDVIKSWK